MALKFTLLSRDACRKAKPGEIIIEHGISFERTAKGDARWKINVMVDGQRVHRVIGKESDGVTREQCEKAIEKLRTEAREGRLNLPKGRKVALGFRQAAEMYLEKLTQEGGKDIPSKGQRFRQYLIPFFGETPLAKISTFDVERYKKQRHQDRSQRGGDRVSKLAKGKRRTSWGKGRKGFLRNNQQGTHHAFASIYQSRGMGMDRPQTCPS